MRKCEKERKVRKREKGKKKKMRRWENNTSWMKRRACDKTPCSLVSKHQNRIQEVTSQKIITLLSTAEGISHFKMETVQAEAEEQRRETGIEERKAREELKKRNRRMS